MRSLATALVLLACSASLAGAATPAAVVGQLPALVGIEPPDGGNYVVQWSERIPKDGEILDLRYDRYNRTLLGRLQQPGSERDVEGTVQLIVMVPTPARPLAAGQVIAQDDLGEMELDLLRTRRIVVAEAEFAVERRARRTLRAGQPILARDLAVVPAVQRNDVVTVVAETGSLRVQARAKALDTAAVGGMVRVQNLDSRKIVVGTVVEPGLVRVEAR